MYTSNSSRLFGLFVAAVLCVCLTQSAWAQGKRSAGHAGGMGGGRPGGGGAGAMARPSPGGMGGGMPGGMSRPNPGAMSRPNPGAMQSRPSPGMSRPAPGIGGGGGGLPQARPNLPQGNSGFGGMSGMSRPAPGFGNARPPVAQLPTTRPSPGGLGNMPTTRPNNNLPTTRPNNNLPTTRPSPGGVGNLPTTRPAPNTPTNRPSTFDRPSVGNRPSTLPSTLPGANTRPAPGTIDRPGATNRPTTRPMPQPGNGGSVRPTFPNGGDNGPMTKPAPGFGGSVRPTFPNRPTTLPGDLGNNGNRPTTRPTPGDRPTTLPGDLTRPTNRPGQIGGNRPTRPGENGSGILPNRPTTLPGDLTKPAFPTNRPVNLPGQIGGNGNDWFNGGNGNWGNGNWGDGNWGNNNWGNGNFNNNNLWNQTNNNTWNNWVQNNQNNWNVNINNNYNNWGIGNNWNNNWNNGWNNGWNNNGWGFGYNNNWGYNNGIYFGDYWCGSYVRPWHNNWYHGCWNDSWCNNWYIPLATGLTGWALGASTSNWGYSYSYSNPYYVQSAQPVYNYSQPIVIYSDASSAVPSATASVAANGQPNAQPAAPPQPTSAEQTAAKDFQRAQEVFKQGDYMQALVGVESALRVVPKDPIMHEFRALCLFATGEYQSAAAVLNSLLATAPGMDWTSMSSLYADVDDYTKQLRRLEDHIRQKPDDAAANFVAAYHYLVLDDKDAAIDALEAVVKAQPKDLTAARLLATLSPPPPPKSAVAEKLPEGKSEGGDAKPEEVDAPTTNLVGTWSAKNDQTAIELNVSEDMNFVWKASMNGQSSELQGKLETSADSVAFKTEKQGTLAGRAVSQGPDKFQFILLNAPADDQGLTFERKK